MPSAHVGSRAYVPSTRASRTRRGRRFVPSFWSALPTLMHDAAAATTNTANSIEPEEGDEASRERREDPGAARAEKPRAEPAPSHSDTMTVRGSGLSGRPRDDAPRLDFKFARPSKRKHPRLVVGTPPRARPRSPRRGGMPAPPPRGVAVHRELLPLAPRGVRRARGFRDRPRRSARRRRSRRRPRRIDPRGRGVPRRGSPSRSRPRRPGRGVALPPRTAEEPSPRIPPAPSSRGASHPRARAGAPWSPTGASDARRTRPNHPRSVRLLPPRVSPPRRGRAPPRKDKRPTKQLFLDLGQKSFGHVVCAVCGLLYARGERDEKTHDAFHAGACETTSSLAAWKRESTTTTAAARRRRRTPAIITHPRGRYPVVHGSKRPHHRVGGRGVDVRQGMGRGGDRARGGEKGEKGEKGERGDDSEKTRGTTRNLRGSLRREGRLAPPRPSRVPTPGCPPPGPPPLRILLPCGVRCARWRASWMGSSAPPRGGSSAARNRRKNEQRRRTKAKRRRF